MGEQISLTEENYTLGVCQIFAVWRIRRAMSAH